MSNFLEGPRKLEKWIYLKRFQKFALMFMIGRTRNSSKFEKTMKKFKNGKLLRNSRQNFDEMKYKILRVCLTPELRLAKLTCCPLLRIRLKYVLVQRLLQKFWVADPFSVNNQ